MPLGSKFKEFVLPSKKVMSKERLQLVVVWKDDSRWICETLQSFGFLVQAFRHAEEAVECIAQMKAIAGVLLDVHARARDETNLLEKLHASYPRMPIIAMADSKNIDLLRKSIGQGAYGYVVMPTDRQLLKNKGAHVFVHRSRVGLAKNLDSQNVWIESNGTR